MAYNDLEAGEAIKQNRGKVFLLEKRKANYLNLIKESIQTKSHLIKFLIISN